ncbi:MAG: hypothetical protein HC873_10380 [Leptolyngbyaceae cyanobacterium SL_1_1]|nr:hypothetical protein [Leptolyngbyaceae cyanobacterium RM1_1_2]NJO09985.1 hypothetical protein [Leptolyngbyaceae cyanobacterium SL_1_1]
MSLPLILDLALGLVFTYLILSLLASEIQEIVSTVLQWRAEHLKYSIEQLLAGDSAESRVAAQELANELYNSPVIRSLNHEARGRLAHLLRRFLHFVGQLYRIVTRTRNVFGNQTSGPSYIPSEAFAATLLENLHLIDLQRLLTKSRLGHLIEDRIRLPVNQILNDLRISTANEYLLGPEIKQLEQSLRQITDDFQAQHISLTQALNLLLSKIDDFIETTRQSLPTDNHLSQTFLKRLTYLKRNLTNSADEYALLVRKIQPTLRELVLILDSKSSIYQEVTALAAQEDGLMRELLSQIRPQQVPTRLKDSLLTLAEQAQLKVQQADEELQKLQKEVEGWFDRSMTRAAGVYKRNAKGVGILIGLAIAVILNADSLHIANRLTTDQTIRDSISVAASQLANRDLQDLQQELDLMTEAVDNSLEQFPLPIGRSPRILEQQAQAEAQWAFPIPRRYLGWLITGLAISMGSTFWYDLLNRVVNVRATGSKQDTSAKD